MWMGFLDHGGDTKQGDQMGLGMVYFFLVRLNFHLFVTAQRFFEQTAVRWSRLSGWYYQPRGLLYHTISQNGAS